MSNRNSHVCPLHNEMALHHVKTTFHFKHVQSTLRISRRKFWIITKYLRAFSQVGKMYDTTKLTVIIPVHALTTKCCCGALGRIPCDSRVPHALGIYNQGATCTELENLNTAPPVFPPTLSCVIIVLNDFLCLSYQLVHEVLWHLVY